MTTSLDKILTVSAEEYCRSEHKDLGDFILKGVHVKVEKDRMDYILEYFSERLPSRTEVVAGYSVSMSLGDWGGDYARHHMFVCYASGTALIPRTNKEKARDDNDLNRGN
jgi:hypothetical protein